MKKKQLGGTILGFILGVIVGFVATGDSHVGESPILEHVLVCSQSGPGDRHIRPSSWTSFAGSHGSEP